MMYCSTRAFSGMGVQGRGIVVPPDRGQHVDGFVLQGFEHKAEEVQVVVREGPQRQVDQRVSRVGQ